MGRYLSWLANAVLLVACCFFAARTANAIAAAWLAPAPEEIGPPSQATPLAPRSWQDRQTIVQRNLFNAALIAPPATAMSEAEELEATKLPLELLGTVASLDPEESWATVMDTQKRVHLVLQIGSRIDDRASVERIERARLVLRENGELRELALPEPEPGSSPRVASAPPAKPRPAVRRARRRAPRAQAPPSAAETAAAVFSQAQIVPEWKDGAMVGFRVDSIRPGSQLESMGLENGDVVMEVNGVSVSSPQEGMAALQELDGAPSYVLTVLGEDGEMDKIEFDPEEQ